MDFGKLRKYSLENQIKERNLEKQLASLDREARRIRASIEIHGTYRRILERVHGETFDMAVNGRSDGLLYMNMGRLNGGDLTYTHSVIQNLLQEVGMEDVRVESHDQFRLRGNTDILHGITDYDTFITFSISLQSQEDEESLIGDHEQPPSLVFLPALRKISRDF